MNITKFEQGIFEEVYKLKTDQIMGYDELIDNIRKIMPPTCTPTERKFLDRIREAYKFHPNWSSTQVIYKEYPCEGGVVACGGIVESKKQAFIEKLVTMLAYYRNKDLIQSQMNEVFDEILDIAKETL